jgi:hypothetical protein
MNESVRLISFPYISSQTQTRFIPGLIILLLNSYVIFKIFASNRVHRNHRGNNQNAERSSVVGVSTLRSPHSRPLRRGESLETSNHHLPPSSKRKEPASRQLACESRSLMRDKHDNNTLDKADTHDHQQCRKPRKTDKNSVLNDGDNDHQLTSTLTNIHTTSALGDRSSQQLNKHAKKINLSQVSHYATIITVGFYFILSTIPYVMLITITHHIYHQV